LIGGGVTPRRLRRTRLVVRQHAGLVRRLRRPDRPTPRRRAARNVAGRAQLLAVAQPSALAQDRHPEPKIRPAHPGPPDRPDAAAARAFLDGARVKALHLGLVAPRLALGKKAAAAATRQHAEKAKNDGADEIPTHSPRHGASMRWMLLTFLQRLI